MKWLTWLTTIMAWAFLALSFASTSVMLSIQSALVALFFIIIWATLHVVQALDRVAAPAKAQG